MGSISVVISIWRFILKLKSVFVGNILLALESSNIELEAVQEFSDGVVVQLVALLLDVVVQLLVGLGDLLQAAGIVADVAAANLAALRTNDRALVEPLVLLEADVQLLALFEAGEGDVGPEDDLQLAFVLVAKVSVTAAAVAPDLEKNQGTISLAEM